MHLIPSQQQEKLEKAIEFFEQQYRLEINEPCDCGNSIRHNNGGNYHQWVVLQKDDGKIFVKYGDTCELTPSPEWEELTKDYKEVIANYVDWL